MMIQTSPALNWPLAVGCNWWADGMMMVKVYINTIGMNYYAMLYYYKNIF